MNCLNLGGAYERFKTITAKIDLRYCNSKESLLDEIKKTKKKPCTYLVDYEFSGKTYTGLDLIEKILSLKSENDRVFLVTSRSGERELQAYCLARNIFMIPKFFAVKIPMIILDSTSKTVH